MKNHTENEESPQSRFFKAIERNDRTALRRSLQNGDNPNWEENGNSALFRAAWLGYIHIVVLLLKFGANPNWRHLRHKGSPLQVALQFRHREVAKLLVWYGADPQMLTETSTPLEQIAGYHKQKTLFKELLRIAKRRKPMLFLLVFLFVQRSASTAERFFFVLSMKC